MKKRLLAILLLVATALTCLVSCMDALDEEKIETTITADEKFSESAEKTNEQTHQETSEDAKGTPEELAEEPNESTDGFDA